MTTAEALAAARKLIDTPEKWCQNSYATTIKGRPTRPLDASAKCFCSAGACLVATGNLYSPARDALDRLVAETHRSVVTFNDHHSTTHADVMALFDRAIAGEEGK